jgi:hypothetical protein
MFTITESIKQMQFFSDFEIGTICSASKENPNEPNSSVIHIDMPFLVEIVTGTFSLENPHSKQELIDAIKTMSYLMMSTTKIVEELVWLVADNEDSFKEFFEFIVSEFDEDSDSGYSVRKDLPQPLRCELLSRYPFRYDGDYLGARFDESEYDLYIATYSGNLRLVKFIYEKNGGSFATIGAFIHAAAKGHLDILKYMDEIESEWSISYICTSGLP